MSATLQTEQAQREAEIRAKLPDDCTKLLDAAQTDPGAPFEPAAVAMLSKLRAEDAASWMRMKAALGKCFGITLAELARATAPAGEGGDGKQGRPIEWDDPELYKGGQRFNGSETSAYRETARNPPLCGCPYRRNRPARCPWARRTGG